MAHKVRTWGWSRRGAYVLLAAAMLVLAACSASGKDSGINFSLGLAGSTADHASSPPTIAQDGPGGTYAFVYDNQIWLKKDGDAAAKQLTHMVLSNGSQIAWGPLVWSESRRYIAFALVENLNLVPGAPPRTSGPIYYVDTASENGNVFVTSGTGSVYGHTYSWFGDSMIVYSNGSGIMMFALKNGDNSQDDARPWQVVAIPDGPQINSAPYDYYSFGDIQIMDGYLYYTRLDVRSPGRVGQVGSAEVRRAALPQYYAQLAARDLALNLPLSQGESVASLGALYADPTGGYVTGAWQLRGDRLVLRHIQGVDVKAGTVASQVCVLPTFGGGGCDQQTLSGAKTQPISGHPRIVLGPSNKAAFTGDAVYVSGSGDKVSLNGTVGQAAWSPDGTLVVTQITPQKDDGTGLPRYDTSLVVVTPGQAPIPFIKGAQNISWK